LAQTLGLRVDVLARLPLLGYFATDPHGGCWTFTESNGAGNVVGITRRYRDGKKLAVAGGGRGLIVPDGWDQGKGPVFAVEGPSDTLAMLALGLAVVGRPSNYGGADYLGQLLKAVAADREIIIVGEWDPKPDGKWPGRDGAASTAAKVAATLGRPVKWALPPVGAKDVRAWLVAQSLPGDCLDAWHAAGERLSAALVEKAQAVKPEPAAGFQWQPIDSGAFAAADYRPSWLIRRVLVARQPAVIGGPKKSLKTSLLIDLAVSLASATPFLGTFEVPATARVAVLSGESGPFTLQETACRVCAARGLSLADLGDRVLWQFVLPQLGKGDQLAELGRGLRDDGIEVAIIDPIYLSLLAGRGPGGARAENLFEMGPLLLAVSQTCLDVGCTPTLAHHATKNTALEPLDLDSLSYSGIAEFARQWLLVSRRAKYQAGTGEHKLWLNVGGSSGHGGLWGVDVSEGSLADDFTGRKWDVAVQTFAEERRSAEDAVKEAKKRKAAEAEAAADVALLAAIRRLTATGEYMTALGQPAAGYTAARDLAGVNPHKMTPTVDRLVQAGLIRKVEVTVRVGFGQRKAAGLQRREDDS
jgi:hypothetical protein